VVITGYLLLPLGAIELTNLAVELLLQTIHAFIAIVLVNVVEQRSLMIVEFVVVAMLTIWVVAVSYLDHQDVI
jgi:hypothetical protein